MVLKSLFFSLFNSLAVTLISSPALGQDYICGTDLSASVFPSSPSADIPKISKVWKGKQIGLVIKIAFSDLAYTGTDSTINSANASINTLYRSMSRNTFEWDFRIYPKTITAPGTAASYGGTGFNALQSWISAYMKDTLGLKLGTDYNVYIASFPHIDVAWAGLSNLRDADWINGSYGSGVTGHELGHSLGLMHAHSIEAGADMFGIPGTTSQTNEYGNPFDILGRGGINGHFNVMSKWRIGWIDTVELKEIKTSGVYRVYASDNALHRGRLIGIRVPTGNPAYAYWFEYRSVNTGARNGATLFFQGFTSTTNMDTWFMDTTPGSRTSGDESDGVLAVGKEFTDKYGTATFKTVGLNSGVWDQEGWVELNINIVGTILIKSRNTQVLRNEWLAESPLVNLLGRKVGNKVEKHLSGQVLILNIDGEGHQKLVLQQR